MVAAAGVTGGAARFEIRHLRKQLAAAIELQQVGWQKYWNEVIRCAEVAGLLTRAGYAAERREQELLDSQSEARALRADNARLSAQLADARATVQQLRDAASQASACASRHREELSALQAAGEEQSLLLRTAGASEPLIRAEQTARDTVCDCALMELHRLEVEAAPPSRRVGVASEQCYRGLRQN
eukprot:TRINITY_DN46124_c0_g2_i1.p1 TRINITY_DN46124_c0_g2~~TRINITY_DN46124_c0_g2_i1.p1  ORF type:complete len:185 (+),score=51.29 TRINITY_DN46124_c0_g2_i1:64-618(+)